MIKNLRTAGGDPAHRGRKQSKKIACRGSVRDRDRDHPAGIKEGVAIAATGDNSCSHYQIDIRHNNQRVLSAALGLYALAVGRRSCINVPGHRCRADETDGSNNGVIQDSIYSGRPAVAGSKTARVSVAADPCHWQLIILGHEFLQKDRV
jgi:hypothetical protein